MALEGSIRDFSLADIFQLIGIQRKTGVLTLKSKDEEVKVSFMGGMVVNADSQKGRVDDRLGSVLAKSGKVTPEDLERALLIQKQTLKKLGVVLIESGIARPEDLRDALNIQITQIVYRLFRWKTGDYHFEQDVQVEFDRENFTPMSAESILMEGMRMIDEWPVIERKITSFALVFERVALDSGQEPVVDENAEPESSGEEQEDDFDLIFGGNDDKPAPAVESGDQIRLTREEGMVYERINGHASVQEIIEHVMLPEFEVCRALYDLSNRNLIVPLQGEQSSKKGERIRSSGPVVGRRAAAIVPLAAAAWIGVAWAGGLPQRLPLNFLIKPPSRNEKILELNRQEAINRARRVLAAIDVYVMLMIKYPTSLDDLLQAGLIDSHDLRDPWGGEVKFEILPDRVTIGTATGPDAGAQMATEEYYFQQ